MNIRTEFAVDFKYEHYASGMSYAAICIRDYLQSNPEFEGLRDYSNKVFDVRILPLLGRHLQVRVDYWKPKEMRTVLSPQCEA